LYLRKGPARAKDLAPKYLKDGDRSLRFYAALVVFRTGDRTRARKALGDALATQEVDGWLADAVDLLLGEGRAESKEQVPRVFSNGGLRHERHGVRARILRRCAKVGMGEPYRFYLPLLDINKSELPMLDEKGEQRGASYFKPTVAEEFAREIVNEFAPDDPPVREIEQKYPKATGRIPHLKQWLRSRSREA
jgi:hypothetical protein